MAVALWRLSDFHISFSPHLRQVIWLKAVAVAVAMPRYGLIGDSSLYCKRGKRHKYVTEVLSQRLGKVDLIAYPGRGALRMKELLKETKQKGEHYDVLGVSYFGASDL